MEYLKKFALTTALAALLCLAACSETKEDLSTGPESASTASEPVSTVSEDASAESGDEIRELVESMLEKGLIAYHVYMGDFRTISPSEHAPFYPMDRGADYAYEEQSAAAEMIYSVEDVRAVFYDTFTQAAADKILAHLFTDDYDKYMDIEGELHINERVSMAPGLGGEWNVSTLTVKERREDRLVVEMNAKTLGDWKRKELTLVFEDGVWKLTEDYSIGRYFGSYIEAENAAPVLPGAEDMEATGSPDFLVRAYELGYTDEMITRIKFSKLTEAMMLDPESNPHDELNEEYTSDGKYKLSAYWCSLPGERPLFSCMYVKDTESGKISVLPELGNVFSSYGLLGDRRMYASILHTGGTDTRSGVRIYSLDDVRTPVGVWYPDGDVPLTGGELLMSNAIFFPERECLIIFWAVLPDGLDRFDQEALAAVETCKATVIDYNGNIINEFDTGMALKRDRNGVLLPGKGVKSPLSEAGKLVFEFDGKEYTLDLDTGEILKREWT